MSPHVNELEVLNQVKCYFASYTRVYSQETFSTLRELWIWLQPCCKLLQKVMNTEKVSRCYYVSVPHATSLLFIVLLLSKIAKSISVPKCKLFLSGSCRFLGHNNGNILDHWLWPLFSTGEERWNSVASHCSLTNLLQQIPRYLSENWKSEKYTILVITRREL